MHVRLEAKAPRAREPFCDNAVSLGAMSCPRTTALSCRKGVQDELETSHWNQF